MAALGMGIAAAQAPVAAGSANPSDQNASASTAPAEIVAAAPAGQWARIAPEDLLVIELAPPPPSTVTESPMAALGQGATGAALPPAAHAAGPTSAPARDPALAFDRGPARDTAAARDTASPPPAAAAPRRVVIQLIAPPYSQGWVTNIRRLAMAHWWDGLAIVRAQDNYVVQWGDPAAQSPGAARPLPPGLQTMPPHDYVAGKPGDCGRHAEICPPTTLRYVTSDDIRDAYADSAGFVLGWPVAVQGARSWPVHCYGTVGVGRDVTPDTGTGAELYAVIGQAPRQLDRNIAVVGRVIEGIEHLSTLPRGTAVLGFYATPEERTPIVSARLGSEVPNLPGYEYLTTSSESFASYVHARANRRDDFYVQPAGAVDVCNVPVPVRRVSVPEPAPGRKKRSR